MELEPIINSFEIEGSIEAIQKLNKGLINTTYLVSTKDRKYIFQSINTSIFKNIEAMMRNIEMVNEHLKNTNYKYETLAFIKTKSNTNLLFDSTNTPWRCYTYIEHKNYDFSDLNNEIMLLFSDAEDQGDNYTLGAEAWADNLSQEEINRTESFILLDMIGDADLQLTKIIPSSQILTENMMILGQKLGLSNQTDGCNGQRSDVMQPNQSLTVLDDHVHPFSLGIPSLDIIDLAYGVNATPFGGYWHTTQDTADKVSAESLESVGRIVELGLLTGAWTTIDTPLEQSEQSELSNNSEPEQQQPIEEATNKGADSSKLLAVLSFSVLAISLVSLFFLKRFVE